ncbi:hypothetical protein A9R05_33030 (plasmid) [Burkholderia sp. KK1]|nr:hypothetical protein A9R05_33030 [Burkholderia sp. KK1]
MRGRKPGCAVYRGDLYLSIESKTFDSEIKLIYSRKEKDMQANGKVIRSRQDSARIEGPTWRKWTRKRPQVAKP